MFFIRKMSLLNRKERKVLLHVMYLHNIYQVSPCSRIFVYKKDEWIWISIGQWFPNCCLKIVVASPISVVHLLESFLTQFFAYLHSKWYYDNTFASLLKKTSAALRSLPRRLETSDLGCSQRVSAICFENS